MTLISQLLKPRRITCRHLIIGGIGLFVIVWIITYHGQKTFEFANASTPSPESIVDQAKGLKGKMYDPLQGKFNNIGGRIGFIVCADVPNIAYGRAGFSLKSALRRQYLLHPTEFDSANGNTPQNPFFHRRARNLYAYFKSSGQLVPQGGPAQKADVAFYGPGRDGPVVHIAVVSQVTANDFCLIESAPETVLAREVSEAALLKKGWTLVGLGRLSTNSFNE